MEPDVPPTMSRTWRTGRPADMRAAKFRVNRAITIFCVNAPKIGILSLMGSTNSRMLRLCLFFFHHMTNTIIPMTMGIPPILRKFDRLTRNCVAAGSSPPRSANMSEKMGTMKISMAVTMRPARQRIATGYVIADFIFCRSLTSASRLVAILSNVSTRNPPISPAFTIEITRGGNTFSCFSMASVSREPESRSFLMSMMTCLRVGLEAWSLSTSKARDRGSPALFNVASCRMKFATSFGFTLFFPEREVFLEEAYFVYFDGEVVVV